MADSRELFTSLRSDRVGDLRLREAVCVTTADSAARAVALMAERGTGCVLVVEADGTNGPDCGGAPGKLVGILTERDFVARVMIHSRDASEPVGNVMTRSPRSVGESASVLSAVEAMSEGGRRHLPVVDAAGRPVGVLSVKDVMHYLVEFFPGRVYNLPPTPDQTQPAREGA